MTWKDCAKKKLPPDQSELSTIVENDSSRNNKNNEGINDIEATSTVPKVESPSRPRPPV